MNDFPFQVFGTLVPLAIVGLVVYGIVRLARGRNLGDVDVVDPGIGTVRRLYFYTVSFVALLMATIGLMLVATWVLESLFGGDVLSPSRTQLAAGVALTLVGLPIWAVHWRLVQRHVGELPVERRSWIRKLYIYLLLGIAGGVILTGAVDLLEWVFGADSFSGSPWAEVIVWSLVWGFHWMLERAEGQPTTETVGIRRMYVYLASLVGLVMAAVGFGLVIHLVLLEAYEAMFSVSVLSSGQTGLWRDTMRTALAVALVGSAAWGFHWFYVARDDRGSVLRQAYLYAFSSLGGAVTVLVSVGIMLYWVLVWAMGVPANDDAGSHFRFLPRTLAALIVGVAFLAYHWTVLRREAEVSPVAILEVKRSYAYILATLGLGALVVAIGVLVANTIAIFVDSARRPLADPDFWRNPLALVITLAVLGAPLWGYFWRYAQHLAQGPDVADRSVLVRRLFLFLVLGVGALAFLGSGSFLIFVFLRDALEGDMSLTILEDTRTALGIIVAAAIFLPYYWLVYRQDRRLEPAAAALAERYVRKSVTALVSRGGETFVQELEAELGYRMNTFLWADPDAMLPELSEADLSDLARRVSDTPGTGVLLVPDDKIFRVLSYE